MCPDVSLGIVRSELPEPGAKPTGYAYANLGILQLHPYVLHQGRMWTDDGKSGCAWANGIKDGPQIVFPDDAASLERCRVIDSP